MKFILARIILGTLLTAVGLLALAFVVLGPFGACSPWLARYDAPNRPPASARCDGWQEVRCGSGCCQGYYGEHCTGRQDPDGGPGTLGCEFAPDDTPTMGSARDAAAGTRDIPPPPPPPW